MTARHTFKVGDIIQIHNSNRTLLITETIIQNSYFYYASCLETGIKLFLNGKNDIMKKVS